MLATRRFLREAGYDRSSCFEPPPDFEPFTITVYVADDASPKHPTGVPMGCFAFEMRVSKAVEA